MPRAFAAAHSRAGGAQGACALRCRASRCYRQADVMHPAVKVAVAASCAAVCLAANPAEAISGGKESVGIFTPLDDQDWSGRDLRKTSFVKASMRRTKFDKSDLTGTSMFGALAEGASFKGATMRGTSIESADMDSADFTDAILEGAQIAGTQFKNNKLDNSDWTDVLPRKDQKAALCAVAKGTNPTTGVDTRESLGCK